MVPADYDYFKHCHALGLVKGPLLEVGSAAIEGQGGNICQAARGLGITDTLGADIGKWPGVDVVADFGARDFQWEHGRFNTVIVFNVLEHTFDPITVLSNAISCLCPGGALLTVVPVVWQLHDFPKDYCRLHPHWFENFAETYGLRINDDAFCWLSEFGQTPVKKLAAASQYQLPSFHNLGRRANPLRYWRSRIVHKYLGTYGRSHCIGLSTIACAMVKAPHAQ